MNLLSLLPSLVPASSPSVFRSDRKSFFLVIAFLAALILLSAGASRVHAAVADTNRIVVMISLDGLAGFYFDDPKAEMPTLRELARTGAYSSSMKASTPTVTWPNHTTLVTGVEPARHGVVGNNYFDRTTGKRVRLIADPEFDKEQIVKVPTIYDVAKQAGLRTAAIRWPATRNARTLDWTIPDSGDLELVKKYSTPSFIAECEQAGIAVLKAPAADAHAEESKDRTYTRAFLQLLRTHRPQLALLHLVDVDHTQHLKGPRTPEAYAAIQEVDEQVRLVWDELKQSFPNQATLFIVSDHGFSPIDRTILPNVVLRDAGLVTVSNKVAVGSVQVVPQGGAAFIYVRDEANRAAILAKVKKAFKDVPGVAKVVDEKGFKAYGVANPKDDPHAPDMILFAEEGNSFGDTAAGALPFLEKPERSGSHGHDANLPHLHATFVAWGAGIKPGVRLGEISNTAVAPTLAQLLGLTLPEPDGKVLKKILVK